MKRLWILTALTLLAATAGCHHGKYGCGRGACCGSPYGTPIASPSFAPSGCSNCASGALISGSPVTGSACTNCAPGGAVQGNGYLAPPPAVFPGPAGQ